MKMPISDTLQSIAQPPEQQHARRRVFFLLLLCVLCGGAFALYAVGDAPVLGGDGLEYHHLGKNALEQRIFSKAAVPPYQPSVDRAPGYPLFIALIYLISGESFFWLRVAQLLLLLAAAWLLYEITIKFAGSAAAVGAGVLCATYLPLVFVANWHLTEALGTFVAVLLIFFLVKYKETPSAKLALALGLSAGLLTLIRPNFALLIFFILAASVWLDAALSRPAKGKLILLALSGFALCLMPWTVRNYFVSGQFIPLTAAKGISLFVSAQQYKGEISYRVPLNEWDLIIKERLARISRAERALAQCAAAGTVTTTVQQEILVDQAYTADAMEKFRSIPVRQYIKSWLVRQAYLWSTGDTSPWAGGGLFHRLVQLQFLGVLLLTVCGLYVSRARLIVYWPLWIIPFYTALIHSVFHMEPRYSLPARPFLLVYAGFSLALILAQYRTRGQSERAIVTAEARL